MKALDVMVTHVITVGPNASVQDVAKILLDNRISAVPVVSSDGALLGIVSEGDLMRRPEAGTERRNSWWLEWLMPSATLAAEFAKSYSRKVTDVMTQRVITVQPETPLHEVANLLEKNRIKRVPVVKNRRLVGIVSRANLLQALASLQKDATAPGVDDESLRKNVLARLEAQPWTRPSLLNVIVHSGTVDLWGFVDSEAERRAARVAAEVTPGVRAVNDNLMLWPVLSAG